MEIKSAMPSSKLGLGALDLSPQTQTVDRILLTKLCHVVNSDSACGTMAHLVIHAILKLYQTGCSFYTDGLL